MATKRWQDGVNVLLGIWLFFSPWILGFHSALPQQSWNFFVIGIAMVVFSAAALGTRKVWEEGVTLALGVWMIISPWLVGFTGSIAARDDAIIVGIVTGVLSVWGMADEHTHRGTGVSAH